MSLERALEEKEQELKKVQSVKFKLWFAERLIWSYIKSVLGFFIPNALVLVIAGSLIGIIAPKNVPEDWISTWVPVGWAFMFTFGVFILFVIRSVSDAPLLPWICGATIFGISCAIPYLFVPSTDPSFIYNGYIIFTFGFTPFVFMLRRGLIIWNGIKSLSSDISSLKKQIEERKEEQRKREAERRLFVENMKKRGLMCFVDRNGRERWGTPEQVEEWKRIDISLSNRFADYTPREFEKFIAKLFQRMGYEVTLGPYVCDYGADIIAKKDNRRILIQVKKYSPGNLVGNREVRDTLGAIWNKADKAIIITTSDFTEQAYEQAKGAPIELWNYQTLSEYVEKYFFKESSATSSEKISQEPDVNENEIDIYTEAYPELSEEEVGLQETQEVDMDLEDEEDDQTDKNESRKQTHISKDIVEVKQVYFLPTKIVNKTSNKKIVLKCRICGTEISKLEYENQKGLCHTCWKRRQEISSPKRDFVQELRRGGLLGADRAGTW